MTGEDTAWLVKSYCNECEDGIIYNNMVTSVGRHCHECDGTGYLNETVTMYETEYEVKEDYPDAIKITKVS